MTLTELLKLLPIIIEAAKTVPAIAELIMRVERGDRITDAEVDAAMLGVQGAVKNWDNTPTG